MSGDMTARSWDLRRGTSENEVDVFRGHGRSVKCIEFKPNTSKVFATGSRENAICIWDTDTSKQPINTIREAHAVSQPTSSRSSIGRPARQMSRRSRQGSRETSSGGNTGNKLAVSKGSVTALQFQDENTLISASDIDGIIKVNITQNTFSGF